MTSGGDCVMRKVGAAVGLATVTVFLEWRGRGPSGWCSPLAWRCLRCAIHGGIHYYTRRPGREVFTRLGLTVPIKPRRVLAAAPVLRAWCP